jgi:hypothetical protein
MKRNFTNDYPLQIGKIRFVLKYTGIGITFSTEIDEVDETCAIAYFKKMYPSAVLISIKRKDEKKD